MQQKQVKHKHKQCENYLPRGHGATQCRTAVGNDTIMSVRVARLFITSLTGPRTFDLHQKPHENLQHENS